MSSVLDPLNTHNEKPNPLGTLCSDCGMDTTKAASRKSCPECRDVLGCKHEYPQNNGCWPWQCNQCFVDNHEGNGASNAKAGRKHTAVANAFLRRKLIRPWWEETFEV